MTIGNVPFWASSRASGVAESGVLTLYGIVFAVTVTSAFGANSNAQTKNTVSPTTAAIIRAALLRNASKFGIRLMRDGFALLAAAAATGVASPSSVSVVSSDGATASPSMTSSGSE